jgi:hypothetical protein
MSAVQARVHASLKMEFKLLKQIIRDYMPPDYSYIPVGGDRAAKQEDYDLVEVIPVSDPNAATMAQRIMQYQAALQLAQGAPQIYDLPNLHRQMLEVLGIKNAEKLVPVEEDQKPRDPISENMSFLTGKPTKAFIYQDHQAHIATHMALLQDPMVAQMIGQSPMAQQMGAAIMAHVAEHMAFAYRQQVEEQLGVPLTPPDAELDEQNCNYGLRNCNARSRTASVISKSLKKRFALSGSGWQSTPRKNRPVWKTRTVRQIRNFAPR